MPAFDPDAYLSNFDPDAYLSKSSLADKEVARATSPESSFTPDDQKTQPGPVENVVKGTVEQLPVLGGMLGGAVGMTAGSVVPGAGTAAGGLTGAAVGGAAGAVVEQGLKTLFWPEEAPKSTVDSLAAIPKGAAVGTSGEAGGIVANKVFGAVAKGGADTLDEAAAYFSQKAIPLAKRFKTKLGNAEGMQKVGRLLRDYGVTTFPRTLRQVGEKVSTIVDDLGNAIGGKYKQFDHLNPPVLSRPEVESKVLQSYKDYVTNTMGHQWDESLNAQVVRAIRRHIKPNEKITPSTLHRLAKTIGNKTYDVTKTAEKSLARDISINIRKVNEEYVRGFAPGEMVDDLRTISSQYNKLRYVNDAIEDSLTKGPSNLHSAIELGKTAAAGAVAGTPGVIAEVATKGTKLTLAKTTAAATTRLGAKILRNAPGLGHFGKSFMKMAAYSSSDKVYEKIAERHANLYANNDKYHDLYNQEQERLSQEESE